MADTTAEVVGVGTGPPEIPGLRFGAWLGAGSHGTVWAAVREADARDLAVKVVHCAGAEAAAQVAREVAVLGGIDVEGLVGFHGVLAVPGEPPAVAILLDRVEGGSLDSAVHARGHLSVGESVTVLTSVARTLAGLHAAGVVHGDLSPANVLLERTGRPRVADLGLARLAGGMHGEGQDAEGEGACEAWATEGFAAPEVVAGDAASAAADVYALGALAWFCATGAAPGPGTVRRPLEELAPGLPEPWRQMTLRALAADPARRPTAEEAALAYFEAAPAEPLRLVLGGDATSLLTQRVRRNASSPTPVRTRRERRGRDRRGRDRRGRDLRETGRRTGHRAHLSTALLVMLTTVGVLGAVAGPAGLHGLHGPRGLSERSARGAPAGASADPAADPAADLGAAADNTVALMQALADLRASAMNASDPVRLSRLDAPSSPALARDTADLAALIASGRRYDAVSFRVRSARCISVTRARATIEASVDSAPYRIMGATISQPGAARAGRRLRFALVWAQERWRIQRLDPA